MKLPLIIIVGRPNVGKSTLFNRLTKSSKAIVDDVSGVTRDRIFGEVDWNGKAFQVIDTGGYVPKSDDKFEIAIKEQVEFSIEEAQAIFFVVDGKIGLNPLDHNIAKLLRKYNKPVFLLINKLDTPQHSMYMSDFYKLGFAKLYDISALNGRNLGDLLDDVCESITFQLLSDEEDRRLRIAIIGRPNVGKSSLTNALLGFDRSIVTDIPGTTRDSINSILKYYNEEIVLIDTAGLRKKAKIKENLEYYSMVRTYRALMECDIAVILIDATTGLDAQDKKIIFEAERRKKGIILAINKWDLIEKETNTAKKYEEEIRHKIEYLNYLSIIFISALTKQRIFKLIELAIDIDKRRKMKINTSELNDTLLPEIIKNPPPATSTGKEIKIKYITQVGTHYPIFIFFSSNAKQVPDNYKKFLENLIRKKFNYSGVTITLTFKDK
ncbi:MAG: ribosome biogenesis GTPase Der [Ignavibacteriales bacterium]|nr:ribosome biogenesis GTPase Der [Ignavibacteriales bacterium]